MMKNIDWFKIFKDMLMCFISACGFAFLFMFFAYNTALYDQSLMKAGVLLLFLLLAGTTMILKIPNGDWFSSDKAAPPLDGILIAPPLNISKEVNAEARRQEAVHVAGHALVCWVKQFDDFRVFVGCPNPRVQSVLHWSSDAIENYVMLHYAGAAAEEILLGNIQGLSYGGEKLDFTKATNAIRLYIANTHPELSKAQLEAEATAEIIRLSKKWYQEAKDLLSEHIDELKIIYNELLTKDILNKADIEKLLARRKQSDTSCLPKRKP
jgi:hypothetical protein